MSKIIIHVLRAIVAIYVAVSLALSILVSAGVCRWDLILHRAPFVLIDVAAVTVEGDDTQEVDHPHMYGYDQHGEYVGFGAEVEAGEKVAVFMVYNPLNNYCDDILWRYDVNLH